MARRSVDILAKLDWITVFLILAIMVCGWFSICGASSAVESASLFSFSFRPGKQFVWIICALVIGVTMLSITQTFYNSSAYFLYVAFMLLLVVTIFIAPDTKGSRSWLHLGPISLQPAEFAKFATALALARFCDRYDFHPESLNEVLKACMLFFIPLLLIVCQKETGSALVYIAFLLVLFREGMTGSVLAIGFSAVVFAILEIKYSANNFGGQPYSAGTWIVLTIIQVIESSLVWFMSKDRAFSLSIAGVNLLVMLLGMAVSMSLHPFSVTKLQVILIALTSAYIVFRSIKDMARRYILIAVLSLCSVGYLFSIDYAFNQILMPHQRTRINVILGLEDDPKGAGYNVNQSLIAIGSGGLTGKGFMNGTQTKLKYVPEQDTDFIFCTVGEEQGFKGSFFVLMLYLSLLLRLIYLAERQSSVFGRVYGYSVACILFFHLFINIGMVLGITPVIGIPLPFFSYGGSSLWGFTILLSVFLRIDCERTTNY